MDRWVNRQRGGRQHGGDFLPDAELCVCEQCGVEFRPHYVKRRRFCSIECMRKALGLPEPIARGWSGSTGSGRA